MSMSHVVAAVTLKKELTRTCVHCHKHQTVKPSERREAVKCHHCGEPLPPKPKKH